MGKEGCVGQSLPSTPEGREEVVPTRDDGGETTGSTVLGTTHAVPGHGTQGKGGEEGRRSTLVQYVGRGVQCV